MEVSRQIRLALIAFGRPKVLKTQTFLYILKLRSSTLTYPFCSDMCNGKVKAAKKLQRAIELVGHIIRQDNTR